MPTKVIKHGSKVTVKAGGSIRVESSRELYDCLRDTVGKGVDVTVDMSDVTDADVSCLQALCSAQKTAAGSGVKVAVILSAAIEEAAMDSGLMHHKQSPTTNDFRSLWTTTGQENE